MQISEPNPATKQKTAQIGPKLAGATFLFTLILLILTPGSLLDKLFFISSGLCPQRPSHTSFFEGQPLPMEARMVGIFVGFGLGLFFLWFIGRGRTLRPANWKLTLALIGLVAPMVLDGVNATLYDANLLRLYEPQLFLRVITGTLSGIGIAVLIQPYFNRVIWGVAQLGSSLRSWKEFGGLLIIGGLLIAATLSGWSIFFWPLAFLTIAGMLALLVMLNLMIYAIATRHENWVRSPAQFLGPAALTFLFTLAELSLLAALRYNFVGLAV